MPRPARPPGEEENKLEKVRQKIARQLADLMTNGYWYCPDCHSACDRIEDDHGQPPRCSLCNGIRIHFVKPIQTQEVK